MAKREVTGNNNPIWAHFLRDFGILVSLSLILGLLGPFGTFSSAFPFRLLYWFTVLLAGYVMFGYISRKILLHFSNIGWPLVPMMFLLALAINVPMTFVITAANKLFFGYEERFWHIFPYVYGICTLVFASLVFVERWQATKEIAERNQLNDRKAGDGFLNRLPKKMGQSLICFQTEDHYLRVYTDLGNALLLHRMKDALVELDQYEGMQVHRSWWVAKSAIEDVHKSGRKYHLILKNGLEVPVSRSCLPKVKDNGYL